MTIQFSAAVRNARLDAIETNIGVSAVLKILSGSMPADCATGNSGTVLATMTLPVDWLAAASAGAKAKLGTWEDTSADAGAPTNAGYFRIYASDGTTCGIQGTITATGGGGDLTLDNISIATAQDIIISSFSLTEANA